MLFFIKRRAGIGGSSRSIWRILATRRAPPPSERRTQYFCRPGGACPAVYQTVLPPLTAIVWPVTNEASSLARYAAAQPTSSGLPQRPIGIVAR